MDYIILFPTEDDKEGFIITSMLQMKEPRHREIEQLTGEHNIS